MDRVCSKSLAGHCDCLKCNPSAIFPLTPPKGEPMPQTREYWEKRAAMDLELIMEQKEEISRLKQDRDKLRKKLGWPSV